MSEKGAEGGDASNLRTNRRIVLVVDEDAYGGRQDEEVRAEIAGHHVEHVEVAVLVLKLETVDSGRQKPYKNAESRSLCT